MSLLGDEAVFGDGKPFLHHLEDLRRTLLWCVAAFALGLLAAIAPAPLILDWLKVPVARAGVDPDTFLKVIRVTGGFAITMRIVFWSGLLVSLPVMLVAIAWFVFPGLTRRERRAVTVAVGAAAFLFAGGVSLGYFLTLPVALRWMLRINAWIGVSCEFVELSDYVAFVLKLLIAFGLACELPIILLTLGSLGIVSSDLLRSKRRHVVVGLMVVAMLLTPPDPFTLLMMAAPMTLLYELCIWLIWLQERRRAAQA